MATYILVKDPPIIVTFDTTNSENHEDTAEVSDHPVEQGVNIVDHVRKMPFTLSVEVFVTNTPIQPDIFKGRGSVQNVELTVPSYEPPLEATPGSLFRLAASAAGAVADLLFGGPAPFKAQVLRFDQIFDRVLETQTVLTELQNKATLCTVVTSTRFYEDMIITRVSLPRTEAGGAAFQIDFRQVRIVQTKSVAAPKPAEPRGAPAANKGAQAAKPLKGKDAVNTKSLALKLLESFGG